MLNKNVIDVLTQVNAITNSILLTYPQTVAVSEAGDMQVLVDISKLDTDEFSEIGLRDSLSDLLSLFKLFGDERTVEISNNTINVNDGDTSSSYITDNIVLMDAYRKNPEQFDKTEAAPSVAEFTLTSDDIKKIKQASSVFKDLSDVVITSKDGDINIALGATNKFNAKDHTYSVTKTANTTKEFKITIPVDNFKSIPGSNYDIQIKYNESRNSYRILMLNKSFEGFKVLLSSKV